MISLSSDSDRVQLLQQLIKERDTSELISTFDCDTDFELLLNTKITNQNSRAVLLTLAIVKDEYDFVLSQFPTKLLAKQNLLSSYLLYYFGKKQKFDIVEKLYSLQSQLKFPKYSLFAPYLYQMGKHDEIRSFFNGKKAVYDNRFEQSVIIYYLFKIAPDEFLAELIQEGIKHQSTIWILKNAQTLMSDAQKFIDSKQLFENFKTEPSKYNLELFLTFVFSKICQSKNERTILQSIEKILQLIGDRSRSQEFSSMIQIIVDMYIRYYSFDILPLAKLFNKFLLLNKIETALIQKYYDPGELQLILNKAEK